MIEPFAQLGWQAWMTMGVVAAVFACQVFTKIPADFAFLGGLGTLLIAGVLDQSEALSGFASRGMVTVGILYLVVAGVQGTGGLDWIVHHVLGRPRSEKRAQRPGRG